MRLLIAITICVCGLSTLHAEELPKPTGAAIVDPDAKWELLFTRSADVQGGLTEGPSVAPDGSIYFTDIPLAPDRGMIMRFDPKTKKTTLFTAKSGKANGLIFDADGFLLACEGSDDGGRRVSRWDVKTGESKTIADRFRGKRFNAPNDLCLDAQGRIYFTDPRYLGSEPREIEYRAVYRIDPDGSVIEITRDTLKPNGIALSPDGRTLYVADHDNGEDRIGSNTNPPPLPGPMKIYAFPLNEAGIVDGERRTIVDFGDQAGCDGMTIDAEGNIYLTARSLKRPGVLVVNPDGEEVAFIPTGPPNQKRDPNHPPVGIPSNAEFGIGDEINVLYVTTDLSLYRIPLKSKGFHVQYGDRIR
ncbi:Gluconolactonase precursor [Symmachiella dynata]|uniref:SMP-30/gluconolactonase/LRE family protein n=1 Tax=Symmachiella dynata TaxID=2527995 RepID=UPI0011899D65|nr:SMP-30/gluconolactonase/LRE family protein [Symmachiella dynata]QDT49986.1 Gluconolactonase precursor [Symmachiella dynata]